MISVMPIDAAERLEVTLQGRVSGPEASGVLCTLYREQPRVVRYDMVFDALEYAGTIGAGDLLPIVNAYHEARPDPRWACRTAFLTRDPFAAMWTRVMTFQFSGREHRPFRERDEAERWLAVPIAERPSLKG